MKRTVHPKTHELPLTPTVVNNRRFTQRLLTVAGVF